MIKNDVVVLLFISSQNLISFKTYYEKLEISFKQKGKIAFDYGETTTLCDNHVQEKHENKEWL